MKKEKLPFMKAMEEHRKWQKEHPERFTKNKVIYEAKKGKEAKNAKRSRKNH